MTKITCIIFMTTLLNAALAGRDTVSTADTLHAPDTAAVGNAIDTTTLPDSLLPPLDTARTNLNTEFTTNALPYLFILKVNHA